jgi:hypothetical protein
MPSKKKLIPIYVHDGDNVAGDADLLTFSRAGKAQAFHGDSDAWGYSAFGDAFTMQGRAHGGNDVMFGGDFVGWSGGSSTEFRAGGSVASLFGDGIVYAGDAQEMSEHASGGDDTLDGGRDSVAQLMGDAIWMGDGATGGNDVVMFGPVDVSRSIPRLLDGSGSIDHLGLGDAFEMDGAAHGGDDTITGADAMPPAWEGAESLNLLAGDAWVMADEAVGGNDRVTGGSATGANGIEADDGGGGDAVVENYIAGDTFYAVGGSVVFGKDVLVGGNADGTSGFAYVLNVMAGDQLSNETLEGGLRFGNDTLYGGSGSGDGHVSNMMMGDSWDFAVDAALVGVAAASLHAVAPVAPAAEPPDSPRLPNIYGGDRLYGGDSHADNQLVGDSEAILQGERGGNDYLVAGTGPDTFNLLVGDAYWIQSGATGGNDTLVSGMGDDQMWGDAYEREGTGGADTFVFGPHNGYDMIYDFEPGVDHINLRALRLTTFAPHTFRALLRDTVQVDDGVVIHLGGDVPVEADQADGGNAIHILGITLDDLTAAMFTF